MEYPPFWFPPFSPFQASPTILVLPSWLPFSIVPLRSTPQSLSVFCSLSPPLSRLLATLTINFILVILLSSYHNLSFFSPHNHCPTPPPCWLSAFYSCAMHRYSRCDTFQAIGSITTITLVNIPSSKYCMQVCVYVLKCATGTFYTGITKNLQIRLFQHNTGTCKSTMYKLPVTVLWYKKISGYRRARALEVRIKNTGALRWIVKNSISALY